MWLWNWLVPSITGWSSINYLQAAGLFLMMHIMSGTLIRVKHLGCWSEEREEMTDEDRKKAFYRMTSKMDNGLFSIKRTTIVGDSGDDDDDDNYDFDDDDFDDDEEDDFEDEEEDEDEEDDDEKHSRTLVSIEIGSKMKKEFTFGQAAEEDGEK